MVKVFLDVEGRTSEFFEFSCRSLRIDREGRISPKGRL
jgi:hypothetical protein